MSVDLNSKCRTCLSDSNTYHQLLDYVEENYKILEMLDGVVPQIGIKTTTQFSSVICQSCVDKLLSGYKFQQLCIETNNRLHDLLGIPFLEKETEQKFNPLTDESSFNVKQEIEDACSSCEIPHDDLAEGMKSDDSDGNDTDSSNEQLSVLKERLAKDIPVKIENIENNINRIEQHSTRHEKKRAYSYEFCNTGSKSEKTFKGPMLAPTHSEVVVQKITQQNDNKYSEIFEVLLEVPRANDNEEVYNQHIQCQIVKTGMEDNAGIKSIDKFQRKPIEDAENLTNIIIKKDVEMTSQTFEESKDDLNDDTEWIDDDYEDSEDNSEEKLFPKPGANASKNIDDVDIDIGEVGDNKIKGIYPCQVCGKVFRQSAFLKRHSSAIHSLTNEVEKPKKSKKGNGNFPCQKCNKVFCYLYLLKRHSSAHSPSKPYECEICKYRFHTAKILKAHLCQHKSERRRNNYQSRPEGFSCPDCPRRFEKLASLSMHRLIHSRNNAETNYSCVVCQCNFISQRSLTYHITATHPELKHKCDHCNEMFELHSNLVEHLNGHKEKGKHVCNLCGKKYSRHYNLIEHMRSHSGERPYHCTQCDKAFRHSSSLKGHVRTHSGEYPYQCTQCDKKFSNSSNLRTHMERHSDLKKYHCTECPSRFKCRSDLLGHIKVHLKTSNLQNNTIEIGRQHVEKVNSLDKHCGETNEPTEKIPMFIVKEEFDIYEETRNEFQDADRLNKNYKELDDNSEQKLPPKLEAREFENVDYADTGTDKLENSLHWLKQHTSIEGKNHDKMHDSEDQFEDKSNETIEKDVKEGIEESAQMYVEIMEDFDKVKKPKTIKRNGYYPCETCGKVFDSAYRLKRHSSVHALTRPHECEICKYRFDSVNLLKAHLTSHKNEADKNLNSCSEYFQCPDCPKRFVKQALLTTHRHIHSHNSSVSLTEHTTIKHAEVEKYKCDHCGKTFVLYAHLLEHSKRHNCNKNVVCSICQKEFPHRSGLKEHMRKHSPYVCSLCGKTFRFSISYRHHMKRHMGLTKYRYRGSPKSGKRENDNYSCKTCGKVFDHLSELKRHYSSAHSLMRPHKCNVCKYRFVTVSMLKVHLSQHKYEKGKIFISRQGGFIRPDYSGRFKKQSSLSAHQKRSHNTLDTNYSCMVCQRNFKSVRALTVHITKKHPEVEKHKCNRCKKAFVLHSDLVEHLNHHKEYRDLSIGEIEEYKSVNRNGIHHCETCGKVFSQLCLLKRHSSVHSPMKPHECEICKYRFNDIKILKAHLSNHTNEALRNFDSRPEDFKCPDCPRHFDKQLSLSMHRLIHTRNSSKANFTCIVCQRSFMSIKTLTKHIIDKHPEEKHKCNQCDKSFVLHTQLQSHLNHHKKHMVLQSGGSPYVCPQCGKTFRNSLNFKDHMRKHNGEKPFLCPQCGKTFCYSSNFRQHIKRHAGLKKYQCPLCPSRYMRRSDLLRHVQSARYHTKIEKLEKPRKVNGKIVDVYKVNDNEGEEVESKNSKKIITFQCPECPKCFDKLTSLSIHYKIHTKKIKRKKFEPGIQDIEKINSLEKPQKQSNESTEKIPTIIVKEEIEICEEPPTNEFDEELDDDSEKEQFLKLEPKEIKNIDVNNA